MEYDCIVFDTAPTGHTLRLLNFPMLLEKGLERLVSLKEKFSGMISTVGGMFGNKEKMEAQYDKTFSKLTELKKTVTLVKE